jgi:hypothetical protein
MTDKKGKKKIRVVTKTGAPVYKYLCVCHNVPATKPPCTIASGQFVSRLFNAPKGEATLGSWRCNTSNKPCKVSRVKNVAETAQAAEAVIQ